MHLAIAPRRLRLKRPLETAHGTIAERELLDVLVIGADGIAGAGEAAPLESYDGVALDDVRAALEDCRAIVREADGRPLHQVLADCREAAVLPQAVAALDLALWDREGRRLRASVAALLGGKAGANVAVNAVVGATDPAAAARAATAAAEAGHRCVKLKVGVGDDVARVAAVRAALGPAVALRLDANGAWATPAEAERALRALAPFELVEEPVHGVAALRELQAALPQTAVAMDESGVEPGAVGSGATRLVCLKLTRCGGISGLVEAAEQARAAGSEVFLASTFDGPLGIAGALHAAAAIEPTRPCGLATLSAFADLDLDPALAVEDGFMRVPTGPGLGVRA
ncbi:mandelate racemase/muconate lactonizing enzyme family protein [Conexibacter sp. JD483]|uniref:mandelate racemase/muconate lactonizing enzyme family protein n=1 Tax=unclassified Conexibacter TaxID=2627773 RepID=UPI0027228E3A|nr:MULTISPECIES: mandelate racemase/muconate lactonizing enzyme family protein [unclassified Conexibacter]MDO8185760.1 mandelate racemase/muconate lactonizing enzyme family protein [Conexibacter sp. CPCC 205706]MDO8199137.1 mandelate racemase/muconate lactonizing enzyme family protein [Conexibacter sp. CPCC 205762]MDR9369918.1 mandelate racemase/muconate lactonizing enzyme family protein [Conexibacter sp. JD483]